METGRSATDFVYTIIKEYKIRTTDEKRTKYNQYFTSQEILEYIHSELIENDEMYNVRNILDPAAGIGNLIITTFEYFAKKGLLATNELHFLLFEIDQDLKQFLEIGMKYFQLLMKNKYNIEISFEIFYEDFIQNYISNFNQENGLDKYFEEKSNNDLLGKFDFIILNPPYGKLSSKDNRTKFLKNSFGSHSNLYVAFLSICIELLKSQKSRLVGIIPRSFCQGLYFKKFRQYLLSSIYIDKISIFHERDTAFGGDNVLQENIIIFLSKSQETPENLDYMMQYQLLDFEKGKIVRYDEFNTNLKNFVFDEELKIIGIPSTFQEFDAHVRKIKGSKTLQQLSLKISTGPYVYFRDKECLVDLNSKNSYPIIFPSHIKPNKIDYPLEKFKKPQSMKGTCSLYKLKMMNYVLIRRFSSKEMKHRIIAAPLFYDKFGQNEYVTFDNKVNYIPINTTSLKEGKKLANALSKYLNTDYLDNFYRAIGGTTQINATDFEIITFPSIERLLELSDLDQGLIDKKIELMRMKAITPELNDLIKEASTILEDLEIDYKITTEKAAMILIILADMKEPGKWINSTNFRHTVNSDRSTDPEINETFHAIMKEAEKNYNYPYFNDREEIRRKCLHQFFEQGFVLHNDDEPYRKPNSSKNNYRLTPEVLKGLRLFGTNEWKKFVDELEEK